jgi:hypothetical protein
VRVMEPRQWKAISSTTEEPREVEEEEEEEEEEKEDLSSLVIGKMDGGVSKSISFTI